MAVLSFRLICQRQQSPLQQKMHHRSLMNLTVQRSISTMTQSMLLSSFFKSLYFETVFISVCSNSDKVPPSLITSLTLLSPYAGYLPNQGVQEIRTNQENVFCLNSIRGKSGTLASSRDNQRHFKEVTEDKSSILFYVFR